MSKDQFKDWKEGSEFFFNHLKATIDRVPPAIVQAADMIATRPSADAPEGRDVLREITIKRDTLQEVMDLSFFDIFGEEDDE